jgi:1-hydroxycarotenoid 3,4-desaturase
MAGRRVVVIGAGIGGLTAALALAAKGHAVTVLERAATPGGKMRRVVAGGAAMDAGPTVFTMRHVFDAVFAEAGLRLDDHLRLRPCDVLARHAWADGGRLDLFADVDRSADAIAAFAGRPEGEGYRRFCREAAAMFATLDRSFIQAASPSLTGLVAGAGPFGLMNLLATRPFSTMWQALGAHFRDPRLRQLFGRYATYCGSSPWLAPATLMLVAHVEQAGVWMVEGGMHEVAATMARVAVSKGAEIRMDTAVREVTVSRGRVDGVVTETGERIAADAVVVNADVAAVADGLFGAAVAGAVPRMRPADRSLSALTWCLSAETSGFALLRHTVFFSDDYESEFTDIFERGRIPATPTVYVCAHDRDDGDGPAPQGPERLLVLINAPATGDKLDTPPEMVAACGERAFGLLERCGLSVERRPDAEVSTTPAGFHALFPATGGALYGRASHGWQASFGRPGVRTRLSGLYLAGGSAHPGPGVPMAAQSGRAAAACIMADLA